MIAYQLFKIYSNKLKEYYYVLVTTYYLALVAILCWVLTEKMSVINPRGDRNYLGNSDEMTTFRVA